MPWLTPNIDAPTSEICRRISIPNNAEWIACVTGALIPLTFPSSWEKYGIVDTDAAAAAFQRVLDSFITSGDYCMIGTIIPHFRSDIPPNCLPLSGGVYQRNDYPELYAVLETRFRIDDDAFYLPDLAAHTMIGQGSFDTGYGGVEEYEVGNTAGSFYNSLEPENLPGHTHTIDPHAHNSPPHTHSFQGAAGTATRNGPLDLVLSVSTFGQTSATSVEIAETALETNSTGDQVPFQATPPYIVVNFVIVAR